MYFVSPTSKDGAQIAITDVLGYGVILNLNQQIDVLYKQSNASFKLRDIRKGENIQFLKNGDFEVRYVPSYVEKFKHTQSILFDNRQNC